MNVHQLLIFLKKFRWLILLIMIFVLIFELIYCSAIAELKAFFPNPITYNWALSLQNKIVDLDQASWAQNKTIAVEDKIKGGEVNYFSPSKRFQLITLPLNANYANEFMIIDLKSNRKVLQNEHNIFQNPTCACWLFNEEYVAYIYFDDRYISHPDPYIYVSNLKTGKTIQLCRAKNRSNSIK